MRYMTRGTCSHAIDIDIEDNKLKNVEFLGGCQGNTTGIASLVEGMEIDTVISKLKDIDCNGRGTSCPDQLARILMTIKNSEQKGE